MALKNMESPLLTGDCSTVARCLSPPSLFFPPRRVMDDLSYLLQLPIEIWESIISYIAQRSRRDRLDAPLPLAGAGTVVTNNAAARLLALSCRFFYDLVAPALADHIDVHDVSSFRQSGRFHRSAFDGASDPYLPSTVFVYLRHSVDPSVLPLPQNRSLRGVSTLELCKPTFGIIRTFPDYIQELATCIGPQLQTVHVLPSEDGWFVEDIVMLSLATPNLSQLYIADLRFYDYLKDDDDFEEHQDVNHAGDMTSHYSLAPPYQTVESDQDNDSNDDDGDYHPAPEAHWDENTGLFDDSEDDVKFENSASSDLTMETTSESGNELIPLASMPALEHPDVPPLDRDAVPHTVFPAMEWLCLGQLAFIPRAFGSDDSQGFELLLEGLTPSSCPNLKRLDVLQYVGPIEPILARYDIALQSLCLSSSVMDEYLTSLLASPSLSTLHIIVDSLPSFLPVSHPGLTTISVYLPVALWTFAGFTVAPPLQVEFYLNRVLGSFIGAGLPSLQKLYLFSEVTVPVDYLSVFDLAIAHASFEFAYIRVL